MCKEIENLQKQIPRLIAKNRKLKKQVTDLTAKNKTRIDLLTKEREKSRRLSTELIQLKEEKAHNEQLLDSFQNVLAEHGYKLVGVNDV